MDKGYRVFVSIEEYTRLKNLEKLCENLDAGFEYYSFYRHKLTPEVLLDISNQLHKALYSHLWET